MAAGRSVKLPRPGCAQHQDSGQCLPGRSDLARTVVAASGGNAFELRSTIGQLIALLRRARIFVGGDTGSLHLAAALGIPVVGLYRPNRSGADRAIVAPVSRFDIRKVKQPFLIIVRRRAA